jgi:hypothetical protein
MAGGGAPRWPPRGAVPFTVDDLWYKPAVNIVLAILTCGIWTWAWTFHTAEDLKNYNGDGLGGGVSLVLIIFVAPVVWFTIPNEIEQLYRRDGRASPVTALWGLWFLLPIIGNFVWYLKVQHALNDFWLSKGASPT